MAPPDPVTPSTLAAFGLDADDEALYRVVLRYAGGTVEELSDRTGRAEALLTAALEPLVDLRLVQVVDGRVRPEPPDLALGRLVSERARALQQEEERLGEVRGAIAEFVATHERARGDEWEPVPVEAVEMGDLVDVMETLVRNSSGELLFFRPDQFSLPSGHRMDEVVVQAVSEGRDSRALYPAGVADDVPERVRRRVLAGERARVLPVVPARLAIFGDAAAVLPEFWETPVGRRLVVRQPALVGALTALFEAQWERGVALPGVGTAGAGNGAVPSADAATDDLVALLARGAKDEQIARLLGLSLRTVRRRIATLMQHLGAESRFQAGIEAVRRGLL